ncbi:TRAP transporter substrate-binding protein DctP [uncultured Martelella sp.]|uniref:TRAP transporter substrate-binding protein n=1 Tax=uncultured Martelella sp. TaxID=392331 RepID=UPI0029C7F002|nr:TRAP transporter substrate-binding protein DctP [uncultured Martelella sp.]
MLTHFLRITAGSALILATTVATAFSADYTMRIAASSPKAEQSFAYTHFEVFQRELEARSGGRIDVKLFPGGQLGGIESVVNQIKDGIIQAGDPSDGHIAPYFPDIQVFGIPYLFTSRDVAWEVLDGPFGQKMADMMAEQTGMRPLFWAENGGFRHYSNADRPIETAEDMAGLKMRTMNHPLHMEIASSLGMSPTPVAWDEVYTSLQTGVVDGQENSIPTFMIPKLYEVQKFITLDGHVYGLTTFTVNEAWYEGLPDDLRAAVDQAAIIARTANRGLSVSNEVIGRNFLESEGVTIYDPTPAEKEEFRALAQPKALDWLRERVDPSLIDEALSAVNEAENKLGY